MRKELYGSCDIGDPESVRLADFVRFLEDNGELVRIKKSVSPLLEISEIQHRVSKLKGPALLFENVQGSSMPVLTNIFGTRTRVALALGRSLDEQLIDSVSQFAAGDVSSSMTKLAPVTSEQTLPNQEWETCADLAELPIMQAWPGDAGRYITFGLVYTKNPETGACNCGVYRMQVLDGRTTCIHWQGHSDGFRNCGLHRERNRPMEVAVVIGCEPHLLLAAAFGLPYGASEMHLAGILGTRPVRMQRCTTIDMSVPVSAEIVIEGVVNPDEFHSEGPFGDYTGYYSSDDNASVFHINMIRHRPQPIYLSTLIGKPSLEFVEIVNFIHTVKLASKKSRDKDVVDFYCPPEGAFTNFAFIALRKRYPGHAREVVEKMWAEKKRPSRVKIMVVFDADVNIRDLGEAFWQMGSNIDPARDIFFGQGKLDDLNHSSATKGYGSKLGIDATKKGPAEGHDRAWPEKIVMTNKIRDQVTSQWGVYFPTGAEVVDD